MPFLPQWVSTMVRGPDHARAQRMEEFQKEIKVAEQRLVFRGRFATLSARCRPRQRYTTLNPGIPRNPGIRDTVLFPMPAPLTDESSQASTVRPAATLRVAPLDPAPTIRTAHSGTKPILAPCNFLPIVREYKEVPINNSIVPYCIETPLLPPFYEAYDVKKIKIRKNPVPCQFMSFDENSDACQVCPIPSGHGLDAALIRRDSENFNYPSAASVEEAKASTEFTSDACTDTIAHVLHNDSPEMVGFGRWRHNKNISIKALEDLIRDELMAPGCDTLYGGYGKLVLKVEDHPLVIEHRDRVAAFCSQADLTFSADTGDVYAVKTYRTQLPVEPFGRAPVCGIQRHGDHLMQSNVGKGFLPPPWVPRNDSIPIDARMVPGSSRRDSNLQPTYHASTWVATASKPNPRISRLARAVARSREKKDIQRRSRSANEVSTQLTRIMSAEPGNNDRWAKRLARTTTFDYGNDMEDAIATTDDEADNDITDQMEALKRMPPRTYAAPDQRVSGSDGDVSSGAVTPFTDTPQAGPSTKSSPPTSVERETVAIKLTATVKTLPNATGGCAPVDQESRAQFSSRRVCPVPKQGLKRDCPDRMSKSVTFSDDTSPAATPAIKVSPGQAVKYNRSGRISKSVTFADDISAPATPASKDLLKKGGKRDSAGHMLKSIAFTNDTSAPATAASKGLLKRGGKRNFLGSMSKSVAFADDTSAPSTPASRFRPKEANVRVLRKTVMVPMVFDQTPRWATPPPNYALKPTISYGNVAPAIRLPKPDAQPVYTRAKAALYSTLVAEKREGAAASCAALRQPNTDHRPSHG